MVGLSVNQYYLIANVFAFAIAALGVTGGFLLLQRSEVFQRYRAGVTVAGLLALVSAYNHIRLYQSWNSAFSVVNGTLKSTGMLFVDTYRYSDWLLTVPLLLVALVLVLDLSKRQARLRGLILILLAAEMVVLGFPGQASSDASGRWLWWAVAMVPFTLIVFQLYGSMASAVKAQPDDARKLTGLTRFMILLAVSVYPAVYLLPLLGVAEPMAFLVTQISFVAADLVANGLCGILIYMIASSKTFPEKDAAASHVPALRGLKV